MGQHEILEFLEKRRRLGNHMYVTTKYVSKKLGLSYQSAHIQLRKLYMYGYIECKEYGRKWFSSGPAWHKGFRAKSANNKDTVKNEVKSNDRGKKR